LLECSLVKVNQPAPRTMDSVHVPTGPGTRSGLAADCSRKTAAPWVGRRHARSAWPELPA